MFISLIRLVPRYRPRQPWLLRSMRSAKKSNDVLVLQQPTQQNVSENIENMEISLVSIKSTESMEIDLSNRSNKSFLVDDEAPVAPIYPVAQVAPTVPTVQMKQQTLQPGDVQNHPFRCTAINAMNALNQSLAFLAISMFLSALFSNKN